MLSIPLTGNHPKKIANNNINSGPKKKCGIEIKNRLEFTIILSNHLSWFFAAKKPAVSPNKSVIVKDVIASILLVDDLRIQKN